MPVRPLSRARHTVGDANISDVLLRALLRNSVAYGAYMCALMPRAGDANSGSIALATKVVGGVGGTTPPTPTHTTPPPHHPTTYLPRPATPTVPTIPYPHHIPTLFSFTYLPRVALAIPLGSVHALDTPLITLGLPITNRLPLNSATINTLVSSISRAADARGALLFAPFTNNDKHTDGARFA